MAADSVDKAQIIQFSSDVHHDAQQMKARLRPFVQVKPMSGDVYAYDGLGTIEAEEVAGRVVKRTFSEIAHLRRKIARRRFTVTLPIDTLDIKGVLQNLNREYSKAIVAAMARRFDRVGIEAAFATVKTGRDFETDVTFASDNGLTVTATSGLTYEKILEINQNFHDYEVNNDETEAQLFLISGDEENALMKEIELVSGDYTRQFAVESGRMRNAVGNNLVIYGGAVQNPILSVSAGVRSCIAMVGRALCYGMSQEFEIEVEKRSDYVSTTQIAITGILGAVRTEGRLIQKVTTTS